MWVVIKTGAAFSVEYKFGLKTAAQVTEGVQNGCKDIQGRGSSL